MGREAYIAPDYQVSILSKTSIISACYGRSFHYPGWTIGLLAQRRSCIHPKSCDGLHLFENWAEISGANQWSGFHVDPGFRGHLIYAVYNAGPSQLNLARGMDLFNIWLANLDRTDSHYYRISNTLVENEHLGPSLVNSISGKILNMQSPSDRLASREREFYVIKALVGGAVVIASLIFAAIKIDWKAIFS
jgi:dCTP deaminase